MFVRLHRELLALAAPEVELVHVGGSADEVVEAECGEVVAGLFEPVDDGRGAHRVEVEPRDGVAQAGGLQSAGVGLRHEVVHFEVAEHVVHHALQPAALVGLRRVERLFEELHERLAGVGESGGDGGEQVGPHRRFGGEFRADGFGLGPDVPLEQFVEFVVAVREEDGLAVGVEARSPGPAHHLVDLEHRQGLHPARVARVAPPVADHDSSRGGVHAGGERRRRTDALDEPVAERFLDEFSVLARESGVVERRALLHRVREVVARLGVGDAADLLGDRLERGQFVTVEERGGDVRQPLGGGFGVPAGVDEHERRAPLLGDGPRLVGVVGHRVPDDGRGRLLRRLHPQFLLGAVVEVERLAVVDPFAEVDGSPRRVHERGVEPVGEFVRVADGRGERDDLQVRVPAPEFGERHFQGGPAGPVVDEVDLVRDDAVELVDPRRAVPHQRVDLLRGGDDDVLLGEPLPVRVVVAGRDPHREAVLLERLELGLLLGGERPERDDVERLAAAGDRREHRQFRDERLARRGGDGGDERLTLRDAGFDRLALWRVQRFDPLVPEVLGQPLRDGGHVEHVHWGRVAPHRV